METVDFETGGAVLPMKDEEWVPVPAPVNAFLVPIHKIIGWSEGDPPSEDLVKSLAKRMYTPILVREVPGIQGTYEVVDGRRRMRAAIRLGWEYIPAVVDPGQEDVDSASLITNYLRSDNVLQSARAVWRMMDDGLTEKQIADEHDINIAKIRALRDMRKLRPELIEAVEAGKMTPWTARMAARHPQDTVQQELVDLYKANGRVTSDDVVEVRKVKMVESTGEISDLFENVPQLGEGYDDDGDVGFGEPRADGVTNNRVGESKPKEKVSRQDRLANVKNLAAQAKAEIIAIKSNSRSEDERDILAFLNEILERLENPS